MAAMWRALALSSVVVTVLASCASSTQKTAGSGGSASTTGSAGATGHGGGGIGGVRGSGGDAGTTTDGAPTDGSIDAAPSSDGGLALPSPLRGVTVDDISNLSDVVAALGALPHRPTTRIVFDEGEDPSYYTQAVASIGAVSYIMGEVLDSAFVSNVTIPAYTQRTTDYLNAFPTGVDLWEVGNEINGNWLGNTSDVVAKMTGAYDLVKAAGARTELTLYGCSDDASHDMFNWVTANVPARMLTGLDYVLVSYYEGDCTAPRAFSAWPSVFQQLHQMFPNAGVGFGEVGAVDNNGQDINNAAVAGPYLQKYYGLQINVPNYVGGYFWWYFAEDMVPKTKPLFATLSAALP
jgi:hypothetical protein